MEYDFSGYATKVDLQCADGRTIRSGAFKADDGKKVPVLWQHGSHDPNNVLGHAILEDRPDGTYAYVKLNKTPSGVQAKEIVEHGDVECLSIHANNLIERAKNVMHGVIRELSLVIAGANPGAMIDNVIIQHSDGGETLLHDEAVITCGLPIEHEEPHAEIEHADTEDAPAESGDTTIADILESMTEEQRNATAYLVGAALKQSSESSDAAVQHSAEVAPTEEPTNPQDIVPAEAPSDEQDSTNQGQAPQHDQEGTTLVHNIFDQDQNTDSSKSLKHTMTGDALKGVFEDAKKLGSLKEAVEGYAFKHGIEDIDILFPDAKAVTNTPDFVKRRTEWVAAVISGTKHTPFSRIKSLSADLTLAEARAKGYVKGDFKKEEFFRVAKRVTTPQTVYKRQKLDRDDILDITDFDVVVWLREEMRIMLEEEIARAILVGDGRSNADDDKINETNIRPIATDNELYVTTVYVNLGDSNSSHEEIVEALTLHRRHYRGSGNPTFFTSESYLAKMLLVKDDIGRRTYPTVNDLAAALRVSNIVAVEVMEDLGDLVGILVNLTDYTVGSDRGGAVTMFDDFDIDYNQYKYLIETRISGALTRPKSAIVVRKTASNAVLVTPTAPEFDGDTVTVPTVAGVVYKNKLTNATLVTGTPIELAQGDTLSVIAQPTSSAYYFSTNADDEWTYENEG